VWREVGDHFLDSNFVIVKVTWIPSAQNLQPICKEQGNCGKKNKLTQNIPKLKNLRIAQEKKKREKKKKKKKERKKEKEHKETTENRFCNWPKPKGQGNSNEIAIAIKQIWSNSLSSILI
jgi:hypothetical protein